MLEVTGSLQCGARSRVRRALRDGTLLLALAMASLLQVPSASGAASGPTSSAASSAATQPLEPSQLEEVLRRERPRIVILNLWATWCVPCLREIPDLLRLQARYAERGVSLIGLSMDEPAQRSSLVEPFRLKHFPALRSYIRKGGDLDSIVSVVDPAWNEILPTTYLIGADGRVLQRVQGVKSYEQFEALLKAALAAAPRSASRRSSQSTKG